MPNFRKSERFATSGGESDDKRAKANATGSLSAWLKDVGKVTAVARVKEVVAATQHKSGDVYSGKKRS